MGHLARLLIRTGGKASDQGQGFGVVGFTELRQGVFSPGREGFGPVPVRRRHPRGKCRVNGGYDRGNIHTRHRAGDGG